MLGLLFDMDGVIVDSTELHTAAWREYLQQCGAETADIERKMHGKHNAEIVRGFFAGRELTDLEVFEHGARKERLYRERMAPVLESKLVPGIREFLERHRDLPKAVASNAEPANLDFVLDGAGLRRYFKATVHGHEVECPKPAPDVYLKAARKLGVAPRDCVVFEDSAPGVQAARAAGMRVAGVTTTPFATNLPEFVMVECTIHSFSDPGLEVWLDTLA